MGLAGRPSGPGVTAIRNPAGCPAGARVQSIRLTPGPPPVFQLRTARHGPQLRVGHSRLRRNGDPQPHRLPVPSLVGKSVRTPAFTGSRQLAALLRSVRPRPGADRPRLRRYGNPGHLVGQPRAPRCLDVMNYPARLRLPRWSRSQLSSIRGHMAAVRPSTSRTSDGRMMTRIRIAHLGQPPSHWQEAPSSLCSLGGGGYPRALPVHQHRIRDGSDAGAAPRSTCPERQGDRTRLDGHTGAGWEQH